MEDYIKRTIAAYEASPEKYEDRTKNLPPSDELGWFVEELPKGSAILDAGCAYGREAGTLTDDGFKVAGIDLADAFVQHAKELHPELSFQKADVRNLPFGDETFSGVWCNAVLLHLKDEDVNKALNEFRRVLKPGARLFVSFKKGTNAAAQLETFTSNDERFYNNKLIEALEPQLAAAGFKVTRWRYFNEKELDPNARDLEWLNVHAVKV